ncbi:hypothetical protein ACJW30_03G152200 [Castanea mollissima]
MIVLTLHPQFINRQNWKLDDTNLKIIEISNTQELKEARDIIQCIQRREPYHVSYYNCKMGKSSAMSSLSQGQDGALEKDHSPRYHLLPGPKKIYDFTMVFVSQKWTNSILNCQSENGRCDARRRRYCCEQCLDRFDTRKKQPSSKVLRSILYQDYDSKEVFSIQDDRISHLLPAFYQDMIVRVYSKKPELLEAVSEAFKNFQLKAYGMKAQVHATPDSKKQRRR